MEKMATATRRHILPVTAIAMLVTALSVPSFAQIEMQQAINGAQAKGLSGGSTHNSRLATSGLATVPPHFSQLKLAQGFLLSLNVLDDPDFTGEFRVDGAGNVHIPELGSIHVAGQTVPEAREQISKALLDRGILRDPQVELNVVEYTAEQITILGAVASPGVFPLLAPEGLGDVLAMAGDTTILAGDQIEITTPGSGGKPQIVPYSRGMDTKLLNTAIVHPGDTVQVKQAGVVYVLGGVGRPGGYVMQQNGDMSVLQAISIAGGTAVTASIKTVYVMRRSEDHTTTWLELPYRKMTQGKIADVQLHANDVLFVPTSRLKYAFMNTQGILSSAASASIYAGILY
jgi:polysaccharide export outer membrane protein